MYFLYWGIYHNVRRQKRYLTQRGYPTPHGKDSCRAHLECIHSITHRAVSSDLGPTVPDAMPEVSNVCVVRCLFLSTGIDACNRTCIVTLPCLSYGHSLPMTRSGRHGTFTTLFSKGRLCICPSLYFDHISLLFWQKLNYMLW
jgi:hypothetical protein